MDAGETKSFSSQKNHVYFSNELKFLLQFNVSNFQTFTSKLGIKNFVGKQTQSPLSFLPSLLLSTLPHLSYSGG